MVALPMAASARYVDVFLVSLVKLWLMVLLWPRGARAPFRPWQGTHPVDLLRSWRLRGGRGARAPARGRVHARRPLRSCQGTGGGRPPLRLDLTVRAAAHPGEWLHPPPFICLSLGVDTRRYFEQAAESSTWRRDRGLARNCAQQAPPGHRSIRQCVSPYRLSLCSGR